MSTNAPQTKRMMKGFSMGLDPVESFIGKSRSTTSQAAIDSISKTLLGGTPSTPVVASPAAPSPVAPTNAQPGGSVQRRFYRTI